MLLITLDGGGSTSLYVASRPSVMNDFAFKRQRRLQDALLVMK